MRPAMMSAAAFSTAAFMSGVISAALLSSSAQPTPFSLRPSTETPGFQDVYEEFKGDGFVILQAMFEDYDGGNPDEAFINEWRAEYGITFTIIPDNSNDFWDTYVPPSNTGFIPHNLLIDKDGVISFTAKGGLAEGGLRTRVNALVAAEPSLDFAE